MSIRSGRRIGFTGAGGTGKTTSAITIAKDFNLPAMQSASRRVYGESDLSEDKVMQMSPEEKWELQSRIFEQKIFQDDTSYSFVSDRTLLDHYSYCLMYCGEHMRNSDFQEYENKVRKHMRDAYTHIFYFPIGYWEPRADGVRSAKEAWQSAIDAIIVGYVLRWNLPVIEVPQTEGQDIRNNFIKGHILGETQYDITEEEI